MRQSHVLGHLAKRTASKTKEKKRLGIVAAFCVLDDDHSGSLSLGEMREFLDLPQRIVDVNDRGEPVFANFLYAIKCHTVEGLDVPSKTR